MAWQNHKRYRLDLQVLLEEYGSFENFCKEHSINKKTFDYTIYDKKNTFTSVSTVYKKTDKKYIKEKE